MTSQTRGIRSDLGELLRGDGSQLFRAQFAEQVECALEIGMRLFSVAEHASENAVLQIRVRLGQRVAMPTTNLQGFFEERNAIRVAAQAEDLAKRRVNLRQCMGRSNTQGVF